MKRIIAIIVTTLLLGLALLVTKPALAYDPLLAACADNPTAAACEKSTQTTNPLTGTSGTLYKAANLIAIGGGIIGVVVIAIAGIRFATSAGDPAKVSSARNTILYTVIGLVIILIARSIVVFAINKLN